MMKLGFMGIAANFADDDFGVVTGVTVAPKGLALRESRENLKRIMSRETGYRSGERKAASANIAEVNAWLADKTSTFARIVPCRRVVR